MILAARGSGSARTRGMFRGRYLHMAGPDRPRCRGRRGSRPPHGITCASISPRPIRQKMQAWECGVMLHPSNSARRWRKSRLVRKDVKHDQAQPRPALEHQQTARRPCRSGVFAVAGVQPGEPVHRGEELPSLLGAERCARRTHPALPPARRRKRPADRLRCRPRSALPAFPPQQPVAGTG